MVSTEQRASTERGPGGQLTAEITSVVKLMQTMKLDIPAYQRPYTWTAKNVSQLVSDIRRFSSAGHYRIGTFILHPSPSEEVGNAGETLDIVDGQQRFLTFALIATALASQMKEKDADLTADLHSATSGVALPVRKDGRSERNLRQNYAHLVQLFSDWDTEERLQFTEFFLEDCSVVVLRVRDLDAAFQMFDSQNTRGRALYPTDLLKAYHLREFSQASPDRESMLATVREWEAVDPAEINHVIAEVLFRIKLWSSNRPIPHKGFTPHDISLFKGIKEGTSGNSRYRWARQALLAKASVDRFQHENATLLRHGVVEELEYPFLITQPVIDGEAFFQSVHHYVRQTRRAGVQWESTPPSSESYAASDPALKDVLEIINQMPPGTGNRYVRELFDCFLIAFVDRFGWEDVKAASLVLARHTFLLRIHLERVQASSVDLHARMVHDRVQARDENLFSKINQAMDPEVVLSRPAPVLEADTIIPKPLERLYSGYSASDEQESQA